MCEHCRAAARVAASLAAFQTVLRVLGKHCQGGRAWHEWMLQYMLPAGAVVSCLFGEKGAKGNIAIRTGNFSLTGGKEGPWTPTFV